LNRASYSLQNIRYLWNELSIHSESGQSFSFPEIERTIDKIDENLLRVKGKLRRKNFVHRFLTATECATALESLCNKLPYLQGEIRILLPSIHCVPNSEQRQTSVANSTATSSVTLCTASNVPISEKEKATEVNVRRRPGVGICSVTDE